MRKSVATLLFTLAAIGVRGQERPSDRLSVPFSDPSRPGTVRVSLLSGSITVSGYEGKEVVVQARVREDEDRSETKSNEGERRIP